MKTKRLQGSRKYTDHVKPGSERRDERRQTSMLKHADRYNTEDFDEISFREPKYRRHQKLD